MMNGQLRSTPPDTPDSTVALTAIDLTGSALWRRQIRHDIRHELGTIILLASVVAVSENIEPANRVRIEQLLSETRWIDHLLRQLDEEEDEAQPVPRPERVRVDELIDEVVSGVRLTTACHIGIDRAPVWTHIETLALWRAVRNLLDNACRMARTQVQVSVLAEEGWVAIQVDDDGPGFGAGTHGLASLGLGIVHDLVSGYGGRLEIRHGDLGGARVRILLPEAPPPGIPAWVAGAGHGQRVQRT